MDKYLKMADVFVGEYKPAIRRDSFPAHRYGEPSVELYGIPANYASHAINSHDELVENMLHYKKEAERWEAIAVKEASMVQEFDLEVERLRDMVVRMQTYLDMAGEYPEKESDNPLRQWLFDAIDCTK